MPKFVEGDKVYDITSDEIGTVSTVYPEVNIAIVNFNVNTRKVSIDDLAPMRDELVNADYKRKTLLGKVRGVFK